MIEVSGLTKTYPSGCKAIDHLDLSIRKGEIYALLGPNGAGKTSTIRVLATLAGFDAGRVVVGGHDVDTEPDKVRAAIGFVGQQTGVDHFLTGRENLTLHGQLYRIEGAALRRRIDELARYFALEDSLDTPAMTYSGGMRRKLDIAASLVHNPRILFLDEPTLGLDIASRKGLWQLIERLNRELELTILLTTHYLEEADRLAHRVAIINAGRIRVVDTPEALKDGIHGDAVTLAVESPGPARDALASELRAQPYIRDALWEQDNLHLYLDNAAANIGAIMQIAAAQGVQVKHLSLSRPTLDDVFIKYTGASIEGGGEAPADEWWKQWAGKGGGWGQGKQWQKWAGDAAAEQAGEAAGDAPGGQPAGASDAGAGGEGDWRRWAAGTEGGGAPAGDAAGGGDWPKWSGDDAEPEGQWNKGRAGDWPSAGQWDKPAAPASEGTPDEAAAAGDGTGEAPSWPDAERWRKDKPGK